jgi:hypothetical protein
VALDLFNNVFLLHFPLKAAQSVFEGFPLLQSNFRQLNTPPSLSGRTVLLLQGFDRKSSGQVKKSAQEDDLDPPGAHALLELQHYNLGIRSQT